MIAGGGGPYNSSSTILKNCIIENDINFGGSDVSALNCVIYSSYSNTVPQSVSNCIFSSSQMLDPENGDYRFLDSSPAYNAGNLQLYQNEIFSRVSIFEDIGYGLLSVSSETNDFYNNQRVNYSNIDIGAVEYNLPPQIFLTLNTIGNGSITPSPSTGFYNIGDNINIQAIPNTNWLFTGWSGDISSDYQNSSTNIILSYSFNITANFSDDADQDGLSNEKEIQIGTNPRNNDSDGDGILDNVENSFQNISMNFNPNINSSNEINILRHSSSLLYSIIDYRVKDIDIAIENNLAILNVYFEESTDGGALWSPISGRFCITNDIDKMSKFYEVELQ